MSAWAPFPFARANALSKSSRLRTSSDRSLTPNALAAASISVRGQVSPHRTRLPEEGHPGNLGEGFLEQFQPFAIFDLGVMVESPVIFPPGRARL